MEAEAEVHGGFQEVHRMRRGYQVRRAKLPVLRRTSGRAAIRAVDGGENPGTAASGEWPDDHARSADQVVYFNSPDLSPEAHRPYDSIPCESRGGRVFRLWLQSHLYLCYNTHMLYNPATPTVQEILTSAASLLMDVGGTVSNQQDMRKWFRLAWDLMQTQLKRHSLNEMTVPGIVIDVPAGETSFGPTWSAASTKLSSLDGIARFNPPLYLLEAGFPIELKQATSPLDLRPGNSGYYNYFSGVFYINAPIQPAQYTFSYISNLACPTDGPCGIEGAATYLSLISAYLSGNADGNVGANLREYKALADTQLNDMIDFLVSGEGPITPGVMDFNDEIDGTRRLYPRFSA